jgi:hypothetical protein
MGFWSRQALLSTVLDPVQLMGQLVGLFVRWLGCHGIMGYEQCLVVIKDWSVFTSIVYIYGFASSFVSYFRLWRRLAVWAGRIN